MIVKIYQMLSKIFDHERTLLVYVEITKEIIEKIKKRSQFESLVYLVEVPEIVFEDSHQRNLYSFVISEIPDSFIISKKTGKFKYFKKYGYDLMKIENLDKNNPDDLNMLAVGFITPEEVETLIVKMTKGDDIHAYVSDCK